MRRKIVVLCLGLLGLGALLVMNPTNVSGQETNDALGVVSYGFDPETVIVCDATKMTSLVLELVQSPGDFHDLSVAFHNPAPIPDSDHEVTAFVVTVPTSEGQTQFTLPVLFPPDRPGPKGATYGDWFIDSIEVRDIRTGEVHRYEPGQASPSFSVQPCTATDQAVVAGGTDQVVVAGGTDQVVVAGGTDQVVVAGGTDQTVVAEGTDQAVVAGQSADPTQIPAATPTPTPDSGLAYTGSNHTMLALIGIGLILNGLVVLELTRRRASY